MKNSESTKKVEHLRFLKKMVIFNYAVIIVFIVTILIIYCYKDAYPEVLSSLVFGFFSVQVVLQAMIKILEPKQKKQNYSYGGNSEEYPTEYPENFKGDEEENN